MRNPTIKAADEYRRSYGSPGRYHRVVLPDGRVMVGAVSQRKANGYDYDSHAALIRYAQAAGFVCVSAETGDVTINVTVVIGGRPLYPTEGAALVEVFAGVARGWPTAVRNVAVRDNS